MDGDLSAMSSLPGPAKARLTLNAAGGAIAGALFVGLMAETLAAGSIWALGMLAALPELLIFGGEGVALVACAVLTVAIARRALHLETQRAAGLPV